MRGDQQVAGQAGDGVEAAFEGGDVGGVVAEAVMAVGQRAMAVDVGDVEAARPLAGAPGPAGAAGRVAGRLLEACDRNLWAPDEATLAALREANDELEDRLEGVFPAE